MHARTHELLEFLDREREVLRSAFDSVRPELRNRTPPAGGWSVANVIEHVAIVEKRVAMRIAASIGEARNAGLGPETSADPVLPTIDLAPIVDRSTRFTASGAAHPTGLGAEAAWDALERSTAIVRGTLIDADGLAIGTLELPHPVLGMASLYRWFVFVGGHEARHAAQIHEIARALSP